MAHTQCIACDGCGTHRQIPNDYFVRDEPLRELPNHWVYLRVHEDDTRHQYRAYCTECIQRGKVQHALNDLALTPTQEP